MGKFVKNEEAYAKHRAMFVDEDSNDDDNEYFDPFTEYDLNYYPAKEISCIWDDEGDEKECKQESDERNKHLVGCCEEAREMYIRNDTYDKYSWLASLWIVDIFLDKQHSHACVVDQLRKAFFLYFIDNASDRMFISC